MIRTNRLHIRPLNYQELLCRIYSRTGHVKTDEDEHNILTYGVSKMKEAPEEDHKFYTIWVAEDNGEEVLECGFICPPTVHHVVELFCYTRPEHQKKGYGTEAIKGLVRFSEAFKNIKFICASVAKENKPSQKMFLKNGFYYLCDAPSGMMVFNKQIKN